MAGKDTKDNTANCPYHYKHENQITNLEDNMDKAQADIQALKQNKADNSTVKEVKTEVRAVKDSQRDPRIWVAIFGFVGVCMSTVGSILAVLLTAYFKIGGTP